MLLDARSLRPLRRRPFLAAHRGDPSLIETRGDLSEADRAGSPDALNRGEKLEGQHGWLLKKKFER